MNEVIKVFFGNEGLLQTLGFIFFTIFAMFFVKLLSFNKKKKQYNIDYYPERMKFNKIEWIDDNSIDFILAFLSAFGVFRFFPDAMNFLSTKFDIPQLADKMAYGILLGLFFQFILHKLMGDVTVEKTIIKMNKMSENNKTDNND